MFSDVTLGMKQVGQAATCFCATGIDMLNCCALFCKVVTLLVFSGLVWLY